MSFLRTLRSCCFKSSIDSSAGRLVCDGLGPLGIIGSADATDVGCCCSFLTIGLLDTVDDDGCCSLVAVGLFDVTDGNGCCLWWADGVLDAGDAVLFFAASAASLSLSDLVEHTALKTLRSIVAVDGFFLCCTLALPYLEDRFTPRAVIAAVSSSLSSPSVPCRLS